MAVILLADNDKDFLNTRREYLEKQGHRVVSVSNLAEAKRALERGDINLAILDIRLVEDDDEKDISGLILAKEGPSTLPKIILTEFPNYGYVVNLRPHCTGDIHQRCTTNIRQHCTTRGVRADKVRARRA